MSDDNAAIVRGAYDAFGRGDVPGLLARLDEDVIFVIPAVLPHSLRVNRRDDVTALVQSIATTWSEFALEVDHLIACRDRVCVLGHASGVLDGTEASYGFVHVWAVRDGLCTTFVEYVDPSPELVARAARVSAEA